MKIVTIENTNQLVPSEVPSLKDNPTKQDINEWGHYHQMIFIENYLLNVMHITLNKYQTVIEKYYNHTDDLTTLLEGDDSLSAEDKSLVMISIMLKKSLENIPLL